MTLNVYVPKEGTAADRLIDAGSGIVGDLSRRTEDGRVPMYFEGNRYGASNIVTFADRCHHAASRMLTNYPTTAFGYWHPDPVTGSFFHVGTFDPETGVVTCTDSERLAAWLGSDSLDEAELARGGR